MNSGCKHILVVAHHELLRETRTLLLEKVGYKVTSVGSDDDAMNLLETHQFDLILLGRRSSFLVSTNIDQRLREKYPDLLILKIDNDEEPRSVYPSRITDPLPSNVLAAIREMLGLISSQG